MQRVGHRFDYCTHVKFAQRGRGSTMCDHITAIIMYIVSYEFQFNAVKIEIGANCFQNHSNNKVAVSIVIYV